MPAQPATDLLEALATRVEGAGPALRRELSRLIRDAAELLLDLNREYLEAGQTADGQSIQPNGYSPAYAAFKAKYGKFKQVERVDLKFSGEFLESFDLIYLGGLRFQIVATDAKYAFLSKYGELLGIRDSDLDDFMKTILKPEAEAFLRSYFAR